jgi:hypothetical protein
VDDDVVVERCDSVNISKVLDSLLWIATDFYSGAKRFWMNTVPMY